MTILNNFCIIIFILLVRRFRHSLYILPSFFYFVNHCESTSVTLGIDWGEEFVEASIAFRGHRPDILLTGTGSRKFENAVYLLGDTRLFDKEASSFSVKDPTKTLQKSAHLLGVPFTSNSKWSRISTLKASEVAETLKKNNVPFHWDYTPYEFGVSKDGQLHLKVLKDSMVGLEEATGHFFNHLKYVALEKLLSLKAIDSFDSNVEMLAVISIPCNYTQNQRKALVFAAESAGLKVVDLVHGISAAAWFHTLEMSPGTRKIMYYDLGSYGANVGVVEAKVPPRKSKEIPHIRTLSCVTYPGIGGRQHDLLLAEYLRNKFETENDLKLMPGNPKSLQKLLKNSNKAKMKLSLSNSASVEVDNLVKNKHLNVKVTRSEFDKLLEPVLKELHVPINMALEKANLKFSDLDSVEMLGGAWRVPSVTAKLSEIVNPLRLGFHLNAEESIAMGCGYLAAAHNPFFRMKKIELFDNAVYEYVLHVKGPDLDKRVTLYKPIDRINNAKKVKVNTVNNFNVTIYETSDPNDPSSEVKVLDYKIKGVDDLLSKHKNDMLAQVTLSFKTENGLISLNKVFAKPVKKAPETPKTETSKSDTDPSHEEASGPESKTESETKTSDGTDSGYESDGSQETSEPEKPQDKSLDDEPESAKKPDEASKTTEGETSVGEFAKDTDKNLDLKPSSEPGSEDTDLKDKDQETPESQTKVSSETTPGTGDLNDDKSTDQKDENKLDDQKDKSTTDQEDKSATEQKDKTSEQKDKMSEQKDKTTKEPTDDHVNLEFVDNTVNVYHDKKLNESKNNIQLLVNKDKATIERSQLKNRLESTLYKYKGVLKSDDFKSACKPNEEETLSEKVKSLLEWFDENSYSATSEVLNKHLDELNNLGNPIYTRMNNNLNRESVVKFGDDNFNELHERLNKLLEEKPFLKDQNASLDLFNNNFSWWDQVKKDQASLPLHEDGLFDLPMIKTKLDICRLVLRNLESIPPPVEPKETSDETSPQPDSTTAQPDTPGESTPEPSEPTQTPSTDTKEVPDAVYSQPEIETEKHSEL
ncbi:HSP70 chaperone, putative [Theileria annulata]|uniref:HSP70 chaperone, putative n=1 Tax=Theileria annulata TaxID=5874 RepID=Q4UH29_THEAN|nr:HSP70 chaperone, putative [Theileria annulata]CAI73610.1 HSP70 chaperone, putative [Theileria annulata]|eukprot:XP_954287.1 HSP70 chaperone, putative [Theileria annulata]